MQEDGSEMFGNLWEQVTAAVGSALEAAWRALEALAFRLTPWLEGGLAELGWTEPAAQRLVIIIALAGLAGLGLIGALVLARRGPGRATELTLAELTGRPRRYGYAAALALLLFFGGWSALAPLASAALAPGVISPDGSRKTVDHLEGGIVRAIHVREGDAVAAGAALVTLEDVQARARYEELRERYLYLLAVEARLTAERSGALGIGFPDELLAATDASVRQAVASQRELLESRRSTQAGRERILKQRVRQLDEQNAGLEEVYLAQERQLALIREEIAGVQQLFDKGLAQYPRLLALKRAEADLEAEKAANRARIAENAQRIGETEIQLLTLREEVIEKANDELAEVQRQLAEIRSQMPSRADILARTVIRAPIAGTVMNVRATTESGVIRPGEPILEIVPRDATLIIDARVRPADIDRVRPGMQARVLLTAYRQRTLPLIHGVLRSVSADRLTEERSGEAYFLAKVEVNAADLASLEEVRLLPGMPAEIMLLDDEQTLVDYLLSPILQSLDRSFREN
jgi:HlyD family type I secretion membrane fusion protein